MGDILGCDDCARIYGLLEKAEAEVNASRGVIARLKEGQKNLNANLEGARAEVENLREVEDHNLDLIDRLKKAEAELAECNKSRLKQLGLDCRMIESLQAELTEAREKLKMLDVDKVEAYHGEMIARIDALKVELVCEKQQSIDCFVECVDLRADKEKAEAELASIVDEVLSVHSYPESTPNAVGQPVSTEPTPLDLVGSVVRKIKKLKAELTDIRERYDCLDATYTEMMEQRDRLKEECDTYQQEWVPGEAYMRLREALEWYEDSHNYGLQEVLREMVEPIVLDRGKRARTALAGGGSERETCVPQDRGEPVSALARDMHNWYEIAASAAGWDTQESCKVEWDDLPEKNKTTMLIVARRVHALYMTDGKREEQESPCEEHDCRDCDWAMRSTEYPATTLRCTWHGFPLFPAGCEGWEKRSEKETPCKECGGTGEIGQNINGRIVRECCPKCGGQSEKETRCKDYDELMAYMWRLEDKTAYDVESLEKLYDRPEWLRDD